jgi:glycosyltransferase involved in cell wall biosynthesis
VALAKIVHIITELGTGGGQTLMLNLARESAKRHDVTVISLIDRCGFDISDLNVIFLDKKKGLDLKTFVTLYRTLKRIEPDAVHTHLYAALYAFPWFWRSTQRRGVHTVHSDAGKELPRIHRFFQKLLYHRRNVTPVAISKTIYEQVKQLYHLPGDRAALIYNAVDVERYRCDGRTFGKDMFTLVSVAAFHPWKNQRLLLDAFYDVYRNDHALRLIFAGDGPEREAVFAAAQQYGIAQAVTFLGNVNDVPAVLQKGDAFVLCSQYEGLPMSVLEAYAGGLPVISTDVGGVGDVLFDGKNGLLVQPSDRVALAGAIRKLKGDPALCERMSVQNCRDAAAYDIKSAAQRYEQLYWKA